MKNLFNLKNLIWFCAIGLASFSGYYSVFGISKLFSGGSWSIIGMAAMLEFSKLVVVAFLHNHFKTLKPLFKLYLSCAVVVLMSITSIGVYGYLTNSYQETAKVIYKTQNESNLLDQKKKLFQEQKSQVDNLIAEKTTRLKSLDQIRISQQTAYTQQLSQKRGIGGLNKNITSTEKFTTSLNSEIALLTQRSFSLSDSIASVDQNKLTITNQSYSSELGPLLYLSRITGLPMDLVVNWFIIVLVIVFDPLAISLVIAANHLAHKEQQSNDSTEEIVEEQVEIPAEEIIEEPLEVIEDKEEEIIEEDKKDLIDREKSSILEESISDETINEFYDETKKEETVIDNPWKRALPYVR